MSDASTEVAAVPPTTSPPDDVAPYPSGEPRWMAESWLRLRAQLHPYVSTASELTLHPVRFVRRWTSGERFAMNPLSFMASGVAALTLLSTALGQWAGGPGERPSLWASALQAIAPSIYYTEIGLFAHLALKAFGSKRRLSSTIGLSLYAGGSLALLAQALVFIIIATARLALELPASAELPQGVATAVLVVVSLGFVAFYTYFATTMGALHKFGPARMFLVNAAGMLGSGLVMGLHPLPTLHVGVRLFTEGTFSPSLYVNL